ncbi:hypothetical protein SUDANB70_02061 [Streptomyces sp. enrichment culture]
MLAVAGYLVVQYVTGGGRGPGCKVVSAKGDGATYEFTPEQAVNAATITAVGTARDLPERAVTIALATALQESTLRNIDYGDRDSLGLFQQRPSQGWGTPEEIMDPVHSAEKFYEGLEKVPGYTRLPLTVAAQKVQRSGFPQAYAKHEPDAALLAAALTGRSGATLTCEGRPGASRASGTEAVQAALARDFGRDLIQPAGAEVGAPAGAEGGAGATPTPSPSAPDVTVEPDGRTLTLPVDDGRDRAAGGPRRAGTRGWQLAHWAVANASQLRIQRVSYAGRVWVAGTTDSTWRQDDAKGSGKPADRPDRVRITTGR